MKRLVIIFITTLFGGYMIAQSVSKEFATQMAIAPIPSPANW